MKILRRFRIYRRRLFRGGIWIGDSGRLYIFHFLILLISLIVLVVDLDEVPEKRSRRGHDLDEVPSHSAEPAQACALRPPGRRSCVRWRRGGRERRARLWPTRDRQSAIPNATPGGRGRRFCPLGYGL